MGRKVFMTVASLALSACLSSRIPTTQPAVPAPALDADQYRATLQSARDLILRRSGNLNTPVVDAAAGLSIPIPDHPAVRGALEHLTGELHHSIQLSLLRSSEYRDMIDTALDAEGLPRAFAYLPVIESGYSPELTSRAGARGVWQFMAPTARLYGLRIDWWVDERSNPEKSSRAAARYLRHLYDEFGDWPLALASYNCGPGRVRRAMEQHRTGSFWELWARSALPRETRGYVPTFYGTLLIVSDPEAYGFRLTDAVIKESAAVEIEGPVSLTYIASVAGVDAQVLRELNSELHRGLVPPERYALRVPMKAVKPLAWQAGRLREEDPVMEMARFTMRRGDSVTSVARLVGIDAKEIQAINRISSARPGQKIYVPLRPQELSARLQAERFHVVKKGDTLYSVAMKYGISVAELRELNQLSSGNVLRSGERLRVGSPSAVVAGN